MIFALALLACGTPEAPPTPPSTLPAGAQVLWMTGDGGLKLDQANLTQLGQVVDKPDVNRMPRLEPFLDTARPLWIALQPGLDYSVLRSALATVREHDAVHYGPPEGPALERHRSLTPPGPGCPNGPLPAAGVGFLVSISLANDGTQVWATATARPRYLMREGEALLPGDFYDEGCVQPQSCEVLGMGPPREVCKKGIGPSPARVTIGAEVGCFLPLAKNPSELAQWANELPEVLDALGPGDEVMILPDANVPVGALYALHQGLAAKGLRAVTSELPLGSASGPPVCSAEVRDPDTLDALRGVWLADQLAALAPAPAAPDAAPATP